MSTEFLTVEAKDLKVGDYLSRWDCYVTGIESAVVVPAVDIVVIHADRNGAWRDPLCAVPHEAIDIQRVTGFRGTVTADELEVGDYLVRSCCYVEEAYYEGYDGVLLRTSDGYSNHTDPKMKYLIERGFEE